MEFRAKRSHIGILLILLVTPIILAPERTSFKEQALSTLSPSGFSFAAAGDHGFASTAFTSSLARLSSSGATFYLALGDLAYTQGVEQPWCNTMENSFPNLGLTIGNHETFESNSSGGSFPKYLLYCGNPLSTNLGIAIVGNYGHQYYFDYPTMSPLARFIGIMPGIWNGTTSSSKVTYDVGTKEYDWVSSTIDAARASGIPWVIVFMHKVCIDAGSKGCEIGQDLYNLLVTKADLILGAHTHDFERSKGLQLNTSCQGIVYGTFNSACVSNDGVTGIYQKGHGVVDVIQGTFGQDGDTISLTNPNAQYFHSLMGICSTCGGAWDWDGTSWVAAGTGGNGFMKYTVTATSIMAQSSFSGTFQDSFAIESSLPDFRISASPLSLTIPQGFSAKSTITLTSLNGFSGKLSLSGTVSPTTGVTPPGFSINPAVVTLAAGASATSILNVTTSAVTTPGPYAVTVTGTNGSIYHSSTITVIVKGPDFTIFANPTSLDLASNSSGTARITLVSQNSFTGTITLSTVVSPARGLSALVTPTSVPLTAGGTATSTLRVNASVTGIYSVAVTGKNGTSGPTHTTAMTVIVGDFTVTAIPTSIDFPAASSGTSTIKLASVGGFVGIVSLTAILTPSAGLEASLALSSLELTANGANSTLLAVSSGNAKADTYAMEVKAASGGLSHVVIVSVVVRPPPDFNITPRSTSLLIAQGTSGTFTIALVSLNGFAGTIYLRIAAPSGLTVISDPTITLAYGGTTSETLLVSADATTLVGNHTLVLTGTTNEQSHSVTLLVTVTPSLPPTTSLSPYRYVILAGVGAAIATPILLSTLRRKVLTRRIEKGGGVLAT